MREAFVHTKVCLARLSERLRRAVELPLDLAQDDLHHHCSDAAGSAMAVHPVVQRRDGLVLGRCRDEPAQEQRLAEILVMDDPDYRQAESQNLPDIADLKAGRRSAYIHSEGQRVDALSAHHPVRESFQTQRAARQ
jgi:hypothetical protein